MLHKFFGSNKIWFNNLKKIFEDIDVQHSFNILKIPAK